jgi:hypothetical protein
MHVVNRRHLFIHQTVTFANTIPNVLTIRGCNVFMLQVSLTTSKVSLIGRESPLIVFACGFDGALLL